MIEILLPVYNGEKYLREQIDSILNQSYQNWILKIRNDGSSDKSQIIIDDYCRKYPNKIVQVTQPLSNVGLVQSINLLYEASSEVDYIMFSDQDDIWLHNKIELSLFELKQLEGFDKMQPAMVCTDAQCVNQDLELLAKSFYESQKFPPNIMGDIDKMAALNIIQGCTIMINKAACKHIFPLPLIMSIHDMWIGLNCAYYGTAKYIHTPTILYRQHSSNVAGSLNITLSYYINRISKFKNTINFLFKLKKNLSFPLNLKRVLYYKIKFMFKRI